MNYPDLKMVTAVCLIAASFTPAGPALAAAGADSSPAPSLAKGSLVQPFEAEGIDGAMRRVAYDKGSSTVLLFFLSGCPTCHRMLPLWNAAYEQRPKGLEVVGILLDEEPPGFFTATPIAFPVVRAGRTLAQRRALTGRFKIEHVPVTLRVGPGGRVEDVGQGLLDAIRVGQLFRP